MVCVIKSFLGYKLHLYICSLNNGLKGAQSRADGFFDIFLLFLKVDAQRIVSGR